MYKGTLFAAIILVLLGVAACGEIIPSFSNTPEISFKGFTRKALPDGSDSLIISIGFKDGDGNLGSNTQGPVNFFLTPYKRYQGQVIPVEFSEAAQSYNGILPTLKEDLKAGPIEGVIDYRIRLFEPNPPTKPEEEKLNIRPGDIISFKVRVVDRAGNSSETITTEEIKVLQ